MSNEQSREELLRELTDKAIAMWGEARAAALSNALESAVSQLMEVRQDLPQRDVEPGFFQ